MFQDPRDARDAVRALDGKYVGKFFANLKSYTFFVVVFED